MLEKTLLFEDEFLIISLKNSVLSVNLNAGMFN
jgi:hypothetical protein